MIENVEPMAQVHAAAGVLFFDEDGRVLLVRPAYRPGWDIPSGHVRPGETPSEAAAREVSEELGINPPIGRLLVVDWAANSGNGDTVLFVFDGGQLAPKHVTQVRLDPAEIADCAFHDPELVGQLLVPRLVARVGAAISAHTGNETAYLEQ